ncbi:MAG: M23 family metallopeptidase [Bdellovibrionales bacterium]|nr:M23 family metallopeptidase [Bdellovibrionales bacterium]
MVLSKHLVLTMGFLLLSYQAQAKVPYVPKKIVSGDSSMIQNAKTSSGSEYIVGEDIVVPLIAVEGGESFAGLQPHEVAIPKGAELSVLEIVETPDGNEYVRFEVQVNPFEVLTFVAIEGDFIEAIVDVKNIAEWPEDLEMVLLPQFAAQFIKPVRGRLTSKPGMRRHPITRKRKMHNGWDYAAPTGTAVKAAASGKTSWAARCRGFGNLVEINHGSIRTRYAHLSRILVKNGQKVSQGKVIGKVGTTGLSTGPHLHYEKRKTGAIASWCRGRK